MFQWLNKQGVQSLSGFTVQRVHRFYYHYVEGDKTMLLQVDPGVRYEEICLPENSRWLPPNDAISVGEDKLKNIKQNVRDALNFMKVPHRFVEK